MYEPIQDIRMASQATTARYMTFLLALAVSHLASAARDCEASGFCSLGHSKQWVGDIRTGAALREMLAAVSYKKELMTTIFVANEPFFPAYADMALQLVSEARQMGFAHFLLISNTQAGCDKMLALDPLLSCAWDSTEFNGKDPHVHQRLRFFGRAIRLGYNVLQLDGDTVIFRDPYVYLKRPPLAGINLLTSFESGPDTRNNNIGMVYAQNTRPDGPTAWVFRWLVEMTLRWMDDGGLFAREQCGDACCVGFDQALMHGAVSTAQLGRPVSLYLQIVRKNRNTEATKGAREAEQALLRVMELCNHPDVRMVVLPALSVAQPELGFKTHLHDFSNLYFHNMTVPNLAYGYPPALGGRLFAEVPNSSYSSAWHAQLRDDCPDCPWWDEQRPLKGGSDSLVGPAGELLLQTATRGQFVEDHLPKEIIAQGPGWFVQSMTIHRFGTWLGPGVAPLGSHMVIGHVHGWRKQQSQGYKIVVRKMTGRYNWTLAAQLTAPKAPYMVAQPGSSLKLLALAPHIDLERTRDLAEFNTIVLGLLQAALLSKRVAVLPQLPCETPWLHGQKMDDEHRPTDQRCIAPLFNGRQHQQGLVLAGCAGVCLHTGGGAPTAPSGPAAPRVPWTPHPPRTTQAWG
ncbi:hypothetical protein V8C86DRAFT_291546 [Haematococcus lacustris]